MQTTQEFYRIGKALGEGAYGRVQMAQHKLTGHFVAIKTVRKKEVEAESNDPALRGFNECKKRMTQEIQIL